MVDETVGALDREETQEAVADALEGSPILAEVLGDALPQLTMFHVKLSKEGEPRGIIGPRDVGIIWERHILNSAAIVPFIRQVAGEGPTIADIGSGGGFPGIIVAACMPKAKLTLIEPMERRVEWLHEVVDELGLTNVRIMRARSEEAIAQHRHFDVVTCRAVAPMTKLSGWTLPLLRTGGHLVALKGRSAQAEIDKASKELKKRKGANPRVLEAPVGSGLEPTHVVIVDKR